jgi:hypothetical protein
MLGNAYPSSRVRADLLTTLYRRSAGYPTSCDTAEMTNGTFREATAHLGNLWLDENGIKYPLDDVYQSELIFISV